MYSFVMGILSLHCKQDYCHLSFNSGLELTRKFILMVTYMEFEEEEEEGKNSSSSVCDLMILYRPTYVHTYTWMDGCFHSIELNHHHSLSIFI